MDESSTTEEEQVAATDATMSSTFPDESFSEHGKHKNSKNITGEEDSPKDAPEDNTDKKKAKVNSSESEEL